MAQSRLEICFFLFSKFCSCGGTISGDVSVGPSDFFFRAALQAEFSRGGQSRNQQSGDIEITTAGI